MYMSAGTAHPAFQGRILNRVKLHQMQGIAVPEQMPGNPGRTRIKGGTMACPRRLYNVEISAKVWAGIGTAPAAFFPGGRLQTADTGPGFAGLFRFVTGQIIQAATGMGFHIGDRARLGGQVPQQGDQRLMLVNIRAAAGMKGMKIGQHVFTNDA